MGGGSPWEVVPHGRWFPMGMFPDSVPTLNITSTAIFNKKKVEGEVDKVGGGPAAASSYFGHEGAGGGIPLPLGGSGGLPRENF